MNSNYLLPHRFRKYGLILLLPAITLGIAALHWDFEFAFLDLPIPEQDMILSGSEAKENFTNELAMVLILVALVFIAFARETIEDEYVAKLRLDSLLVAVLLNYGIVLLGVIFLYGFTFFYFLVYNMYTVLLLFILRFAWVKLRERKLVTS